MRLLKNWVPFFICPINSEIGTKHTKNKTNYYCWFGTNKYILEDILFTVLCLGCGMPASRGRRAATPTTYYSISSRRHKFRRFERRRTILTKASRLVRHVFLTLLTLTCYLLMTNNRRLDNSSSNVLTAFISRLRDSSDLTFR